MTGWGDHQDLAGSSPQTCVQEIAQFFNITLSQQCNTGVVTHFNRMCHRHAQKAWIDMLATSSVTIHAYAMLTKWDERITVGCNLATVSPGPHLALCSDGTMQGINITMQLQATSAQWNCSRTPVLCLHNCSNTYVMMPYATPYAVCRMSDMCKAQQQM